MNNSLSFSSDYAVFKYGGAPAVRESKDQRAPVSERLVSCLWFSQNHIKELSTDEGKGVEVVSPGIWNMEEGPDFLKAELRIDGELVRGDVEIHIDPGDWRAHRHHVNPKYDNVVAQVSLYGDGKQKRFKTSSGKAVRQISLIQSLSRSVRYLDSHVEIDQFPYRKNAGLGRCSEAIKSLSPERLIQLFTIAGEWRMLEKAERFKQWTGKNDGGHERTLFLGVMEALGYYNNREPFLELAERVPYDLLLRQVSSRLTRPSHYGLQGILLFLSGMMPDGVSEKWDDETRRFYQFLDGIWAEFRSNYSYLPMNRGRWNMRNRPVNNPMRRIAASSLWLFKNRDKPVIKKMNQVLERFKNETMKFQDKFRSFSRTYPVRIESFFGTDLRKACARCVEQLGNIFRCGNDKYWSSRYSLGGKKLDSPVNLIGEKRIDDILVNIVVPIGLLIMRETKSEDESLLYLIYNSLPAISDDKITRLMRHRFFGTRTVKLDFENIAVQQGMHQIFKDYCIHDHGGCAECKFLENLEKWAEHP